MLIYLAAIETNAEHAIAAMAGGAKHVLTSFFYAGYRRRKYRTEWLQCMRSSHVRLIDSGAFTLRTSVLQLVGTSGAAGAADVDYDKFLDKYIAWLQWVVANRLGDYWVELDIAAISSYRWVDTQRQKILAAGLGGGLVNVWHSDQDWDYWLYLLRESKMSGRSGYVAIEGNQLDREPLDYTKFLRAAYDRGVRVHGFRMTAADVIKRWPFYSVDSSSWISATTSGSYTATLRSGGVVNINNRDNLDSPEFRASWRGDVARSRTNTKTRTHILRASAEAWVRAERDVTAYWMARGVDWDSAIESPKVIA